MSDTKDQDADKKVQVGGEMIIPVAALIFTLYYFYSIAESPWTAQVNAFIVGSILLTVVAVFFYTRIRMVMAGEATLGMSKLLEPRDLLKKRAVFVAFTLAYLIGMNWIGFTPATFLFIWGSMLLLSGGKRKLYYGIIALIMALVAWSTFIVLFSKRLPKGVFEKFMAGLM